MLETVLICLYLLWFIALVVIFFIVLTKYSKEAKSQFNEQYFRDIPSSHSPETIQYLFEGKIDTKGMIASLLNVVYKKGLIAEEKDNDYLFVKNDNLIEPLTHEEELLRTWFLKEFGDNNQFYLSNLKKLIMTKKYAPFFVSDYNLWLYYVTKVAKEADLYEDMQKKLTPFFMIGAIPIFVAIISVVLIFASFSQTLVNIFIISFFASAPGLIFLVYLGKIKRKNNVGIELYAKWNAFRNFIKDFGRLSEKELPEVNLWEKYLVYAYVLNNAEEIKKYMNIDFQAIANIAVGNHKFDYITKILEYGTKQIKPY